MPVKRLNHAAQRILPRNNFARSVSVLAGGSAAGQIIVVAASPVLTRLYSPEDFGLLAVYAGLLGILGVIASLRYQLAIPLPESDEEAASLVVLSLLVVLGMTVLSGVVVGLFGSPIVAALNTPKLEPYLWLLPLGLLLMGVYQVFQYWAIRTKAFPAIARTKLTQALGMVGVQIGGYVLGPVALLAGQVAGQAAGSSTLGTLVVQKRWGAFRQVQWGNVAWAANRYRRFPLFSSWGGAITTAGLQLPPVLFASMFSPKAAGLYLLTHRVLALPTQIIGKAVGDAFYSSAADARREQRLALLVANIHKNLAHIAMPPALVLLLAGPDLFELIFGERWRQAGLFSQWMAPWIYLMFIISPLRLFSVLEKQAQGLAFQLILFFARFASIMVGAYIGDLVITVALFSIVSALCWLGAIIWITRTSGNPWNHVWKPSLTAFGWSAPLVAPLALFYVFADTQLLWFAALLLSGLMITTRYGFLLKKAW
jgi:O-antigen/teichoic acid export membrane protein